jgi:Uma2 family endonuclease
MTLIAHPTVENDDPMTAEPRIGEPRRLYAGQRLTADEFLAMLGELDNCELVDGVVVVSPSPTPAHQSVIFEVGGQLWAHLRVNKVGQAYVETDVHLGRTPSGADIVYKPELVFIRTEQLREIVQAKKIVGAPDLVVEVISPDSRRYDSTTKFQDYERFGVREYWLFDYEKRSTKFYRLINGRLVEVPAGPTIFASEAVPGFTLDLTRIRAIFESA